MRPCIVPSIKNWETRRVFNLESAVLIGFWIDSCRSCTQFTVFVTIIETFINFLSGMKLFLRGYLEILVFSFTICNRLSRAILFNYILYWSIKCLSTMGSIIVIEVFNLSKSNLWNTVCNSTSPLVLLWSYGVVDPRNISLSSVIDFLLIAPHSFQKLPKWFIICLYHFIVSCINIGLSTDFLFPHFYVLNWSFKLNGQYFCIIWLI